MSLARMKKLFELNRSRRRCVAFVGSLQKSSGESFCGYSEVLRIITDPVGIWRVFNCFSWFFMVSHCFFMVFHVFLWVFPWFFQRTGFHRTGTPSIFIGGHHQWISMDFQFFEIQFFEKTMEKQWKTMKKQWNCFQFRNPWETIWKPLGVSGRLQGVFCDLLATIWRPLGVSGRQSVRSIRNS